MDDTTTVFMGFVRLAEGQEEPREPGFGQTADRPYEERHRTESNLWEVDHEAAPYSHPSVEIVRGRILFEGHNMLHYSDPEMRELRGTHIAMVFQEPRGKAAVISRGAPRCTPMHSGPKRGAIRCGPRQAGGL